VHLEWRSQHPDVVAIVEHGAGTIGDAVHRPRRAGADGFHSATRRLAVLRLDDEVRVVAPQRIMHEAEAGPDATVGEGALDRVNDRHRAERWDVVAHS